MPDLKEIPTGDPQQVRPDSIPEDIWKQLKTIQEMKTKVQTNITINKEFDIRQPIELPVTDIDEQHGAWREITITFSAYGVGQAQPPWDDADEPVWLCYGTFDEEPRISWAPESGHGVEVQTGVRKRVTKLVAQNRRLSGPLTQSVILEATAFEEDWGGDIVDTLIDAAGQDITSIISLGLSKVPAAAVFKIPQAAADALGAVIAEAAADEDGVGGDESIISTGEIHWWRKKDSPSQWRARKWTLHTSPSVRDTSDPDESIKDEPNSAWYLAEWIIELSTAPDLALLMDVDYNGETFG